MLANHTKIATRPVVVVAGKYPVFRRVVSLTLGPDYQVVESGGHDDALNQVEALQPALLIADLTTEGNQDPCLTCGLICAEPAIKNTRKLILCQVRDSGESGKRCCADSAFARPFRPIPLIKEVERLCSVTPRHLAA